MHTSDQRPERTRQDRKRRYSHEPKELVDPIHGHVTTVHPYAETFKTSDAPAESSRHRGHSVTRLCAGQRMLRSVELSCEPVNALYFSDPCSVVLRQCAAKFAPPALQLHRLCSVDASFVAWDALLSLPERRCSAGADFRASDTRPVQSPDIAPQDGNQCLGIPGLGRS